MEEGREQRGGPDPGAWQAVYLHIRKLGPCTADEAQELTQEFFTHLLEIRGDSRSSFAPDLLEASLRRFLAHRSRRPPGHAVPCLLEGIAPRIKDLLTGQDQLAPEEALDRHWAEEILSRSP